MQFESGTARVPLFLVALTLSSCFGIQTVSKAAPISNAQPSTYVYIADFQKAGIAQYRLAANGALVALSPPRGPAGIVSGQMSVDKSGRFAYVVDPKSATVSHFSIRPDGTLARRSVPAVKTGQEYSFLILDEANGMAYASGSSRDGKVFRYSLSKEGVLTPLSSLLVPDAFRVHAYPVKAKAANLLVVAYALKADVQKFEERRRAVENAGTGETVSALESEVPVHFDVYSTSGTAKPAKVQSMVVPRGGALVFEPSGKFAYLTRSNAIDSYQVGPDGSLVLTGTLAIPTGSRAVGITFDRSGRFAYIDHNDDQNRRFLSQFRRAENGVLMPLAPQRVSVEGHLVNETLDLTGRFLHVTSIHTGDTMDRFIVTFRIGEDGRLIRVGAGRTETGNNASLPQFDPSGGFAYVGVMVPELGQKKVPNYDLLQFRVQPNGSLAPLPTSRSRMNYFWAMRFVKPAKH